MDPQESDSCRDAYDLVADEYVHRIFDELRHKPLDRQLLDRFATSIRDIGPVCDMGCGPGHVARYLHEQGVNVCGVDLSPAMIDRARQLTPEIDFHFFQTDEMTAHLSSAGFTIADTIERDPYPNVEHPSRRSYIFARR
jgi:trans-aconitate methyltransferase